MVRFNQLLNKFQQTNVQREKSQDRKKAAKGVRVVLDRPNASNSKEPLPKSHGETAQIPVSNEKKKEQIAKKPENQGKDLKDIVEENAQQTAKFGLIETGTGIAAKPSGSENRGVQRAYLLYDKALEKKRIRLIVCGKMM